MFSPEPSHDQYPPSSKCPKHWVFSRKKPRQNTDSTAIASIQPELKVEELRKNPTISPMKELCANKSTSEILFEVERWDPLQFSPHPPVYIDMGMKEEPEKEVPVPACRELPAQWRKRACVGPRDTEPKATAVVLRAQSWYKIQE